MVTWNHLDCLICSSGGVGDSKGMGVGLEVGLVVDVDCQERFASFEGRRISSMPLMGCVFSVEKLSMSPPSSSSSCEEEDCDGWIVTGETTFSNAKRRGEASRAR